MTTLATTEERKVFIEYPKMLYFPVGAPGTIVYNRDEEKDFWAQHKKVEEKPVVVEKPVEPIKELNEKWIEPKSIDISKDFNYPKEISNPKGKIDPIIVSDEKEESFVTGILKDLDNNLVPVSGPNPNNFDSVKVLVDDATIEKIRGKSNIDKEISNEEDIQKKPRKIKKNKLKLFSKR